MPVVAVTSASGDQAAAIARGFVAAGWRVRGLTRDAGKAERVARTGAEPLAVDDGDADALARAFAGADAVVFTSPADYRDGVREALARRVADAAAGAGVRRAVVNTAASILPGSGPNADALSAVAAAFEAALPETAVLAPTVYLDNLSAPWMVDAVLSAGVLRYPPPADARVRWISHRTLADFCVAAAVRPEGVGRRLAIGGPAALRGAEVAAAVGRAAVGRPLAYEAAPIAEFVAMLNATFGAPAGDRIGENYRWLETHPDAMAGDDTAAALLGVAPEPVEAWAARQEWPGRR